ncbi:hypothetical protein ACYPKM_01505 [Pseudomonas aeruginosa]
MHRIIAAHVTLALIVLSFFMLLRLCAKDAVHAPIYLFLASLTYLCIFHALGRVRLLTYGRAKT